MSGDVTKMNISAFWDLIRNSVLLEPKVTFPSWVLFAFRHGIRM